MKPSGNVKQSQRAGRGLLIRDTYAKIKKDILSQRLGPGVKLTAEHLATRLDVSRTPIRQALERLNQEGYVHQIPGRGFFVSEMDSNEVRDLYDMRIAIEGHALARAFKHGITKADIEKLQELNEAYESCGTIEDGELIEVKGRDIRNRAEADHKFHIALAELGGNRLIIDKLEDIHERLKFRRRYDGYWYWTTKGVRALQAAQQHRVILTAIENDDVDAALNELKSHIENAWENYEQFLSTAVTDD